MVAKRAFGFIVLTTAVTLSSQVRLPRRRRVWRFVMRMRNNVTDTSGLV
jgi:hypothetical protein